MNVIPLMKHYKEEFLQLAIQKGFVVLDFEKSFALMKSENLRLENKLSTIKEIVS